MYIDTQKVYSHIGCVWAAIKGPVAHLLHILLKKADISFSHWTRVVLHSRPRSDEGAFLLSQT
jgi:hypothetical protein